MRRSAAVTLEDTVLAALPTRRVAFLLRRAGRSLWVLPSVYALGAVLALALGPLASRAVPEAWIAGLPPEAVRGLLSILASGMLAVAIFSLGTMVSAFQAAAAGASPRALPLLAEDRTAQTAIATFIGAFLFSVAGLVGLALELFDPGGRVILFSLAVAMVAAVVATLIRWLQALAGMGGVTEAVTLAEGATRDAFAELARAPFYGGEPAAGLPARPTAVTAEGFAYVQHVDADVLAAVATRLEADVFLVARPGSWVDPSVPLALVDGPADAEARAAVVAAFTLGRQRRFEMDPRFGLRVLAEIATRALSPAVNDPGTAVDVVAAATRLLGGWHIAAAAQTAAVLHPRLKVPPVPLDAVFEDAFGPIARYGAGDTEVARALLGGLDGLAKLGDDRFAAAARAMAERARTLAEAKLDAIESRRLAEGFGARIAERA